MCFGVQSSHSEVFVGGLWNSWLFFCLAQSNDIWQPATSLQSWQESQSSLASFTQYLMQAHSFSISNSFILQLKMLRQQSVFFLFFERMLISRWFWCLIWVSYTGQRAANIPRSSTAKGEKPERNRGGLQYQAGTERQKNRQR